MTIHCFDVVYSPSSQMDDFLETWLTNWTAWTEEVNMPKTFEEKDSRGLKPINVSGFKENRFELEDTGRSPREDADFIMSQLTGRVGYLASYCDWWVVKWHECVHDENGEENCGKWKILDSSNNYSSQQDVPAQVI